MSLTLAEQIQDKCVAFNGVMNKECDNGIKYDSVRDEGLPCIKNRTFTGGVCPQCQFPTDEQVSAIVDDINKEGAIMVHARELIVKYIEETGEEQGRIKCPACEDGTLGYSRVSINGHIWAKCKCGLGWME